jgi:uncharacterized protein (DUF1697 family)
MTRYIAFLRAINVGGRIVKMDELRALFAALGFSPVETFIASGNVIFASEREAPALTAEIAAHLQQALGYEVATFLRTVAEVGAVARYQPFTPAEMASAAMLNVGFLAAPLDDAARATLAGLKTEFDEFHPHGRELYWLMRQKQSESKLTNAIFERRLKTKVTFRGANTIVKLAAKYPDG